MAATTQRQPLMAGNWKMNLNHLEAIALVQKLAFSLTPADHDAVECVVLPPFVDQRLHAAQVRERRHDDALDLVVVPGREAEGELLDQRDRLEVVQVHLPVARHERLALDLGSHDQPA